MNLSIPSKILVKEKSTGFAGPGKADVLVPIKRVSKAPVFGHTKTSRLLFHTKRYPEAKEVTCCMDFSTWEDGDFTHIRRILKKSMKDSPGTFVNGAEEFPRNMNDQMEFLMVAGFSLRDSERLLGIPQTVL